MKRFILTVLLLGAVPALGSGFFPLQPGAVWTLQGDAADGTWIYAMGAPQLWHGAYCHPRVEWNTSGVGGTTYWSEDEAGRILLHGVAYQSADFGPFTFNPPAVYFDPTMQPGESYTSTVNVYEVLQYGDLWHGEFAVHLNCLGRGSVTTPLGDFTAVTVNTDWPGSPAWPWCYGADGALAYGWGVGPVRVTSLNDPGVEWLLSALQGLDLTDAPLPAAAAPLVAAPNPFNPASTLRFVLAADGPARLEVFDVAGRRVATLCDEVLPAGPNAITWRPQDLASGLYLARLTTGAGQATVRLTLLE
jgi:hypothetical protein